MRDVEDDDLAFVAPQIAAFGIAVVPGGAVEGFGAVLVDEDLFLALTHSEGVVVKVTIKRWLNLVAGAAADPESSEPRALTLVLDALPAVVDEVHLNDLVSGAVEVDSVVEQV